MRKNMINKFMRQVLFPPPIEYKEFGDNKSIKLPKIHTPIFSLVDALEKRKTIRKFSRKKLSIKDISTLLHYGLGLNTTRGKTHRYYPSAGGKYPIECYLISYNSTLQKGIYHYNVRGHSLEILKGKVPIYLDEYIPQLAKNEPPLLLIMTGVMKRTTQKYGARGKRYVLLEAGHIGQTIQLLSGALRLNAIPLGGGFDEAKIEQLIGVKHSIEPLLYMFALGYEKH